MELKSIIVLATVDDHQIPPFDGIHIHSEWDGYAIQNILELEHGRPTKENYTEHNAKLETIMAKMFITWKKQELKYKDFADWDDEPDANYYSISFYPSFQGIIGYLEHFSNYLINDCWTGRGADDDYFDYLPSITDVFFQLCKHYQHKMLWEQFMLKLLKLEWSGEPDDSESDPREQCLYRYKM